MKQLEALLITALDRAQAAEEEQGRILKENIELKSVNEKKVRRVMVPLLLNTDVLPRKRSCRTPSCW